MAEGAQKNDELRCPKLSYLLRWSALQILDDNTTDHTYDLNYYDTSSLLSKETLRPFTELRLLLRWFCFWLMTHLFLTCFLIVDFWTLLTILTSSKGEASLAGDVMGDTDTETLSN